MFYVSQLKGINVWDAWGALIGTCIDVLAGHLEQPFPPIRALVVRNDTTQLIDINQISGLYPSIVLNVSRSEIKPYVQQGDELWLIKWVLDRQIIDTEGRRVVRVNDLQLARVRDRFCLAGVDVGGVGLLRRLGTERLVRALFRLLRRPVPVGIIPWQDVAPLQGGDPLRLRISKERISKLLPADIAAILDDLDRQTSEALLISLDDQRLADALEETPAAYQATVLAHLEPERAADILEEMGPDEAADLLADLPEHASERLLELMQDDEAEDVRRLLAYPEDTAGGIMTTEFARVPVGLRSAEALDYLRHSEEAQADETMYYVYVTGEQGHLRGVIALRDLVMASPDTHLEAQMNADPVTVKPDTAQEEVAYLAAKYDLLAVPVVDESGVLLGIVTVDDAIDAVLPTAWKKRIPRFF